MKKWSPVFTSLLVLLLTGPGLGSRHLWQDEVETAERARTILESGYPRVIDASGRVSMNVGGSEIEDGVSHRYSPWLQFYAAAAGLGVGRAVGFSEDAAVRLPFVLAHAATSGLVAWSLSAFAGAPALVASGVGLVLGLQSIRIVHNRTSRYHALLDLFLIVGVAGLAAFRQGRAWGLWLSSAAIFLLPHAHSVAGSLYSLTLGALGALVVWESDGAGDLLAKARAVCVHLVVPGLLSLLALLALSRPWAKEWEWWRDPNLRSLRDLGGLSYGLIFWLLGALWVFLRGARALSGRILLGLVFVLAVLALVERFPYSQPRYYLSLALLGLAWPLVFGVDWAGSADRKWIWRVLLIFCLLPEFGVWLLPSRTAGVDPAVHWFRPLQGLRLVAGDALRSPAAERQPLREAVQYIREHSSPDDPVLIDYVPQLANWYLPGHPIALMPDRTFRTGLNADNPIWSEPVEFPAWHLWYPSYGSGAWRCIDHCDYRAVDLQLTRGRYRLRSEHLGRSIEMCTVRSWRTNQWNNAPFMNLLPSSRQPEGRAQGLLLLAQPCERNPPERSRSSG